MYQLCTTAKSQIIETFIQKRDKPDSSTFIGKGKLEEIRLVVEELKPDLVIFLNNLRPSQQRNISEALKVKVVDRQALILDIFAQRARSREGKMQVELALLNYLLPRLAGLGTVLSRLGGGIGTRGPGETMLETDRRHVLRRIHTLEKDLNKVRSHRDLLRQSRHNKGFLNIAIVGYTNAGKSTLLNNLTNRKALVEDKLFATLDPTVGKFRTEAGIDILLVDTVGFIRHLPHQLAVAFRATLEEVEDSDIIIQVIDISHELWQDHKVITEQTLEELACDNKPTLIVFNKIDLVSHEDLEAVMEIIPDALPVCAESKQGFDAVSTRIDQICEEYFPDFIRRFKKNYNNYEQPPEKTKNGEYIYDTDEQGLSGNTDEN
jgi:GTP-binding protein HflX